MSSHTMEVVEAGTALVILDLNGTILESRFEKPDGAPPPDARARTKWVYFRPGMYDFLRFLFRHYTVAVWTSNIRKNAESIVELAFSVEQRRRLLFIYSRDECTVTGRGYHTVKDLRRVWRQFPQYHADNTYLVDDEADKVLPEQRQCHLAVPEYVPQRHRSDRELARLTWQLRDFTSVLDPHPDPPPDGCR